MLKKVINKEKRKKERKEERKGGTNLPFNWEDWQIYNYLQHKRQCMHSVKK